LGTVASNAGFYTTGVNDQVNLVSENVRLIQWTSTAQVQRPGMFWVWNSDNDLGAGYYNEEIYSGRQFFSDTNPTTVIDGDDGAGNGAPQAFIAPTGYSSGWSGNYVRGLFGCDADAGEILVTGDRAGTAPANLDVAIQPVGTGDTLMGGENGAEVAVRTVESELTALSGATATATSLIPAGSFIVGVTARVTTLITGATSFDIGDGSDVDLWGATIGVAANTTTTIADFTATGFGQYTAANNVVLTANGGNFSAGAVRLVVHYLTLTPATG